MVDFGQAGIREVVDGSLNRSHTLIDDGFLGLAPVFSVQFWLVFGQPNGYFLAQVFFHALKNVRLGVSHSHL
jgi:hypothetical protein